MKRFNKILCVVQPNGAANLLQKALQIAEQSSASLTLLVALPNVAQDKLRDLAAKTDTLTIEADSLMSHADKVRQHLLSQLQPLPQLADQVASLPLLVRTGKPVVEVVDAVLNDAFDLVIKEAEDPDWLDRLMGSDDSHLLRKCPCPVWMLKPGHPEPIRSVMVALDFDHEDHPENLQLNQTLAELGLSLASVGPAELHLVTVYESVEANMLSIWSDQPDEFKRTLETAEYQRKQAAMTALKTALQDKIGQQAYDYIAPVCHLVQGLPARKLSEMARQLSADLVVMGTLARTGLKGIVIGNTAETLLGTLDCSVLAIKPAGFVSPVGR